MGRITVRKREVVTAALAKAVSTTSGVVKPVVIWQVLDNGRVIEEFSTSGQANRFAEKLREKRRRR